LLRPFLISGICQFWYYSRSDGGTSLLSVFTAMEPPFTDNVIILIVCTAILLNGLFYQTQTSADVLVTKVQLAIGAAQVTPMLEAGLAVGFGTDGEKENNNLDMFEKMKVSSLLAKFTNLDAAPTRCLAGLPHGYHWRSKSFRIRPLNRIARSG
jgi:hypothetical protein